MASVWVHGVLWLDILSMKVFVWVFRDLVGWPVDENGGVLDSHLFFYDRYTDLAEYHRSMGRTARAERLAAIAEAHYRAAPDDDEPPEAAAMAMPVPRIPVNTNAFSTTRLVPSPRRKSSHLAGGNYVGNAFCDRA
jgi:hypothetical protein